MNEEKFQKMKSYAEEKGINLFDPDPNVAFRNMTKVEGIIDKKHPGLADSSMEPEINIGESQKVAKWLEANPNNGRMLLSKLGTEVIKLRQAAIDAELHDEPNRIHPLVYTKAEARAAAKHQLLFSDDPASWQRAIQISRNTLCAEAAGRFAGVVASKPGIRFSKLVYLDQIGDLIGLSVDGLRLRFPNMSVEQILNYLRATAI